MGDVEASSLVNGERELLEDWEEEEGGGSGGLSRQGGREFPWDWEGGGIDAAAQKGARSLAACCAF